MYLPLYKQQLTKKKNRQDCVYGRLLSATEALIPQFSERTQQPFLTPDSIQAYN